MINLPKLIGHRGVRDLAPENTLQSIKKAIELNIKWVEIDVKISKDHIPFLLHDIPPGIYRLKCIIDINRDGEWTRGNWKKKIQSEKVFNYPTEITIRSNWDLELEWDLE